MKTSQLDLVKTTQPLVELDEQDLFEVAGGQSGAANYTASNIGNFALATGDGATVTLSGNTLTARAGTGGVAVIAGFVGSLTANYS